MAKPGGRLYRPFGHVAGVRKDAIEFEHKKGGEYMDNSYIYRDDAELIKNVLLEAKKDPMVLKNLKSDANQGSVNAQRLLGAYYNDEEWRDKAIYWFRKAARQNDIEAQFWVGHLLGQESVLYEDDEKAKESIHWLCCAEYNGYPLASKLLETSNPERARYISYRRAQVRTNGIQYQPLPSEVFKGLFTAIGCLIPIIIIILFLIF